MRNGTFFPYRTDLDILPMHLHHNMTSMPWEFEQGKRHGWGDDDFNNSKTSYDGGIPLRALCRQTLLWYTFFISIFKLCQQLNILKRYFFYGHNNHMRVITSMRMLINDEYSSNKVEKSLQKVLQNFFNSLRKILRLFSIIYFCILKNMRFIKNVFWRDACSYFWHLFSFYANSRFFPLMVQW